MSERSKEIIMEDNPIVIPQNAIVVMLSMDAIYIRYHCWCGASGVRNLYDDGAAENLFIAARRHNIEDHRDRYELVDRTG
jgi:hypothetical protein